MFLILERLNIYPKIGEFQSLLLVDNVSYPDTTKIGKAKKMFQSLF